MINKINSNNLIYITSITEEETSKNIFVLKGNISFKKLIWTIDSQGEIFVFRKRFFPPVFLELELFHRTRNLHSSISLLKQGQTPLKKKSVSHIHWFSSASGCYDQRAIVLGGLLSKLHF